VPEILRTRLFVFALVQSVAVRLIPSEYERVGDILVPGVGIRNIKVDIREGVDYCIGNVRFIIYRGILSF